MKYYFNKFISYLIEQHIEITLDYFLILKKIRELIDEGNIDIGRGKMSDKLKDYFNVQGIDYYKAINSNKFDLNSLLYDDFVGGKQKRLINCIGSIQIKNFRGFSQISDKDKGCRFDFNNKQKIILYGPNGSGKSSFSEALEYILTGDIKERKRRNKELSSYIQNNQNLGSHQIILNDNENLIITGSDKEFFKRCLIEKNRITEFSLFHSKDTDIHNHQDALTFLLGFEELDDLISSFVKPERFILNNKDMAKNDLNLYLELYQTEKTIFEHNEKEYRDLQKVLIESTVLFEDIAEKDKFYINNTIIGSLDKSIIALEKELKIPLILSKISKHSINDFEKLKQQKDIKLKELQKCIDDIEKKRIEVNFKKLYEAISSLPEIDSCPACNTDKNHRQRNPFTESKTELLKMKEIIDLEESKSVLEKGIEIITIKLDQMNQEKALNKLQLAFIIDDLKEEDYFQILEDLFSRKIDVEKKTEELSSKQQQKNDLVSKITKYNDLEAIISKGLQILDQYILDEKKNKVNDEYVINQHLQTLQDIYSVFRSNIDAFYSRYIQDQTLGMRSDVCQYYKKINKHDSESDQVSQIIQTINGNNFTIKLIGASGAVITDDAVSYLSEGHLKTLGLAVIWANMKKHDVPFMIFDDVVNAIDIEHRSNIIKILHTDDFLSSKQIIITTHDRLFWEKFCNSFPIDHHGWCSYILLKDNLGIVPQEYGQINYMCKVLSSLEFYDIRQSLLYIRIWLEDLMHRLLRKRNTRVSGTIEKSTSGLVLRTSINSLFEKFDEQIMSANGREGVKNEYEFIRNKLYENIINQEGHAHDEYTYNISHSSTSQEVEEIKNKMLIIAPFINNLL